MLWTIASYRSSRARSFSLLGGLTFATFAVVACGAEHVEILPGSAPTESSGDAGSIADGGRPSSCEALCKRAHACNQGAAVSLDECVRRCNEVDGFSKLRADAQSLLATCIEGRSCQSLAANDAVTACAEEAGKAPIPASSEVIAFCKALAPAETTCGSELPYDQCLAKAKIYDDATIAEGQRCTGRSCRELGDCIATVFTIGPVGK